jgi:hypothetical protein
LFLNKKGEIVMDEYKSFVIPIQDDEQCQRLNNECGTDFKSTDEHINNILDEIFNMIQRTGDNGGWYIYDCIELEVKVKYCPEDK